MKLTTQSTIGTKYHGVTIICTLDSLVEVLGEPTITVDDNVYWDCETEDGDVFSVYSLENEDFDKEMIFRIGSFKKSVSYQAKDEVESLF